MSEHKSWEEKTPEERAEAAAKIKACNDRSYARMAAINRIASETLVKTTHAEYVPGQYGQDYMAFGKAISEIRQICKRDLSGDFPDYEWMAGMMMSKHFDPNRLAQELEAKSPNLKSPNQTIPMFYTPGWLVDLAKKICGSETLPPHGGETRGGAVSAAPTGGTPVDPVTGCQSIVPTHLPSGADGTEPADGVPKAAVVRPQLLRDIGMVMDKRVSTDENGIVTRIHYAGIRHVCAERPAQLWEIVVAKDDTGSHITCLRDHERVFSGVAFFGLSHAADVAISMMIRKIIGDTAKNNRDHFRRIRKATAETNALINKELA